MNLIFLSKREARLGQLEPSVDRTFRVLPRSGKLVQRLNPHFPSIVDIQCGEKAILL